MGKIVEPEEVLRGFEQLSYPAKEEARFSDVVLGIPGTGTLAGVEEDMYITNKLELFARLVVATDKRCEQGPFTKLPETEAERQRVELSKQSQVSDDEELRPTSFCSGCGSTRCTMGSIPMLPSKEGRTAGFSDRRNLQGYRCPHREVL